MPNYLVGIKFDIIFAASLINTSHLTVAATRLKFGINTMKKCSVCGKFITSGYVFDGTDCFCSEECLKSIFPDDPAAADILIDEGERIVWQDCIGTTKTFDDEAKAWARIYNK